MNFKNFGARLAHARDKVAKQEKEKMKEHTKKPPHIHVGSGGGAVVGTNARGVVKKTAPK